MAGKLDLNCFRNAFTELQINTPLVLRINMIIGCIKSFCIFCWTAISHLFSVRFYTTNPQARLCIRPTWGALKNIYRCTCLILYKLNTISRGWIILKGTQVWELLLQTTNSSKNLGTGKHWYDNKMYETYQFPFYPGYLEAQPNLVIVTLLHLVLTSVNSVHYPDVQILLLLSVSHR